MDIMTFLRNQYHINKKNWFCPAELNKFRPNSWSLFGMPNQTVWYQNQSKSDQQISFSLI